MNLGDLFRKAFRRQAPAEPTHIPPEPNEPPDPGEPPLNVPPGTRPVIVRTEEAHIPGPRPLFFRRRKAVLRDAQNAKYSVFEVSPQILTGCSHMVDGPGRVGGISDITGRFVCDKCIRQCCQCGRQTAPTERIPLPQSKYHYLCIICQSELQRKERRAKIWRFILGPFIEQE